MGVIVKSMSKKLNDFELANDSHLNVWTSMPFLEFSAVYSFVIMCSYSLCLNLYCDYNLLNHKFHTSSLISRMYIFSIMCHIVYFSKLRKKSYDADLNESTFHHQEERKQTYSIVRSRFRGIHDHVLLFVSSSHT